MVTEDDKDTAYKLAAALIGAGAGLFAYRYRKEIGYFIIKASATLEKVGVDWLKRVLEEKETQKEPAAGGSNE